MPQLKCVLFLLALLITLYPALAQQPGNRILIQGKVVDKKHHITLPGVTVKVGADATSTDKNGNFSLYAHFIALTEKGISFSCIGYLNARLIYEPNHFYEIDLVENNAQLKEVVIGAGDDIIKRAIKRIPENYLGKPIVIKGILRTQNWRNKSEYFRSDAVIKAYIPPYGNGEKTTVTVLQNHMDTVYDKTIRYIRHVANYNVVDFQDIVHNRYILDKVLKKRKFDYILAGKQAYNGHRVFVINTTLKDTSKSYDKIDATFYIDTASYAFVAANVGIYNWQRPGFVTIKKLNYRVAYQQIGKKWYLAETHSVSEGEYKTQAPQSTIDFIRTEIDSVNAERIPYGDIVQHMDDIFLLNKHTTKTEWTANDTLFKKAETEGKMALVTTTLLDSIRQNNAVTNPPGKQPKTPLINIIYHYLAGNNARANLGLVKMPLSVSSQTDAISGSVNYGVSYGGGYRIYKSLFVDLNLEVNFWNNKHVDITTKSYGLANEFVFNKSARNIILRPNAGYKQITVQYQKNVVTYDSFYGGMLASFELTHRKAFFISTGYNSASGNRSIYELNIKPTLYSIGLGFVIKP